MVKHLATVILGLLLMETTLVITGSYHKSKRNKDKVVGCQIVNDCGGSVTNQWLMRFTRGSTALPKQFPWIVSMGNGLCTGFIVSARFVLTAAACYYDGKKLKNEDLMFVDYGSHLKGHGSRSKCMNHKVDSDNTHMICRLSHRLEFDSHIQPICFPSSPDWNEFKDGTLIVAGFGKNEKKEIRDRDALQWGFAILQEKCDKDSFCVLEKTIARPDIGDLGSPLMLRYKGRMYFVGVYHKNADKINIYKSSYLKLDWIYKTIVEMGDTCVKW